VLIRPHPNRKGEWRAVDYSSFEHVAVWPKASEGMPVGTDQRADYYDSIFHSRAVIGINTSAMIEAAIVGKPTLAILPLEFRDSHLGTLHFRYVADFGGGFVRTATTLPGHLAHLGSVLAKDDDAGVRRSFVERFVRPHGLDTPATPIVVRELEAVAALPARRREDPWWLPPVRALVVAALWTERAPASTLRFWRRFAKPALLRRLRDN
jgi:hypothetical protein